MSRSKNKYQFNRCSKKELVELTVIHYGNNLYDKNRFLPIENRNWVKPTGGLWTSPVNSKYGWKDWCHSEQFRICKESKSFKLKFFDNAKIIIINSLKDLNVLPTIPQDSFFKDLKQQENINYEELVNNGIDAIWLTNKGQWDTRLTFPRNLYGWDCETVLIMNPNCCFEPVIRTVLIEKFKEEELVIFDNDL